MEISIGAPYGVIALGITLTILFICPTLYRLVVAFVDVNSGAGEAVSMSSSRICHYLFAIVGAITPPTHPLFR